MDGSQIAKKAFRNKHKTADCTKCGNPILVQKNKVQMVCDNCLKDLLLNLEHLAKENAKRLRHEKNEEKRREIEKENKRNYLKSHKLRVRLNDITFKMPDILEKVDRNCLKCDRSFVASGKFNRICSRCSDINGELLRTSEGDFFT